MIPQGEGKVAVSDQAKFLIIFAHKFTTDLTLLYNTRQKSPSIIKM